MNNSQTELFQGQYYRDRGIEQAIVHADSCAPCWSEDAYRFLMDYIRHCHEFMAEDVRAASIGTIPEPPSDRAWGGIIIRAVKCGKIRRKGFRNVKNIKAHCTSATLWEVV